MSDLWFRIGIALWYGRYVLAFGTVAIFLWVLIAWQAPDGR